MNKYIVEFDDMSELGEYSTYKNSAKEAMIEVLNILDFDVEDFECSVENNKVTIYQV